MADDDMPDYEFDGALDWIYVEDDFPLADELAETQIPDPGYAGTKYEIDIEELDDFDVFDYWDDLQYGDDSYWDYDSVRVLDGLKRKRSSVNSSRHTEKRRKLTLMETGGDNVRFVNRRIRNEMAMTIRPIMHQRPSFALFPDWKQRFANTDGAPLNKEMPTAMKKAAEGRHEDSPSQESHAYSAFASGKEEGEWEDEEDEETADDMQVELASLDPEMLKSILRQKLGDAGLESMDENTLMQMLGKMLSGEDGTDDAVDDLTNSVLERATAGNDAALSGWLSQQGVSLDAATNGDDEETDSATTLKHPDATDATMQKQDVKTSPSDSAIDMQKAINGTSTELAIHPPSPTERAKKRVVASTEAEDFEPRKKKKVSFNVPSSVHPIHALQDGVIEAQEAEAEAPDPPKDERLLLHETTSDDDNIQVTNTKAANATAVSMNGIDTADATERQAESAKKPPIAEPEPDAKGEEDGDEIVVASAPAPAKNTRKRKAEAEKAAPKKQARKASGPSEAAGKRTRDTRSKAKGGK